MTVKEAKIQAQRLRLKGRILELRCAEIEIERRYNPYHDPINGRFTSPNIGAGATLYVGKGEKGKGVYVLDKPSGSNAKAGGEQKKSGNTPEDIMNSNKTQPSELNSLPKLTGSEKQIEWANNIRESTFSGLDIVVENTLVWGRTPGTGEKHFREITPEINERLASVKYAKDVYKEFFGGITSASGIIDARHYLRNNTPEDFVNRISATKKKFGRLPSPSDLVKQMKIDAEKLAKIAR